ncbi:N-6 DNA methylase [Maribacter sp. HTCC2170]|uniref:N-6 DNA methylase n=1 Tax=Maribacter sp. (strain HTCC2170 / KCCM 42371) TaxID=313603 RepID=UPI001ED8F7A4
MFLRYLDELEQDKADEAELKGEEYKFILDEEYRWPIWAMPKDDDGKLDYHKAMTGPDLVQFVDRKLFPYLAEFKQKADNPKTIEYKIGEIFSELKNKIKSGYNLREILEYADELPFRASTDKHELSHLYESKIKNMGNAGRNGGQYYTPRPLIRAMINVIDPQIGEKIYDGAAGSCGFLCETYEYMYERMEKTTGNLKTLQEETLYGKEKKNLAYVIGVMNMILHGIEAPNIIHTNTLGENVRDIQEKNRYHVILANPPFGGKERKEVQQNFDIKTGETASLFLQHFIKSLKTGGRAAIVIKDSFLSNNTEKAYSTLRKNLLGSCELNCILDLPRGTFYGAGVKTVVLFFTKGAPTKKIWYYKLDPKRTLGKTKPLNDNDFKDFLEKIRNKEIGKNSWIIKAHEIDENTCNLTPINPNEEKLDKILSPNTIISAVSKYSMDFNSELQKIKTNIDSYLSEVNLMLKNEGGIWKEERFGDVCEFVRGPFGGSLKKSIFVEKGIAVYEQQHAINNQFEHVRYYINQDKFNEMKRFELKSGDLIMSCSGTMGKVAIVPKSFEKGIINQALLKLSPNPSIDVNFLKYWMESKVFKLKIEELSMGAAIKNVASVKILKEIMVPIPPIEIQKRIIQRIDSLVNSFEDAILITRNQLNHLEDLGESLLQETFEASIEELESA